MKYDGQIDRRAIAGECMAAIAEYCCCDVCGMETHPCITCVDKLDWVDTYEICLDVAKRVKGERAMSWDEFLSFRDCVCGLMQSVVFPAVHKSSEKMSEQSSESCGIISPVRWA